METGKMFKSKFVLKMFVFGLFVFGVQLSVQAQATRTWVSGVGDDVNPCSRTAPCKTFAGAISKTATNGEINCIDDGGFGAVTITKSITIDCTAEMGSILASGTNGIVVNITSATDTRKAVTLRGVNISGATTGLVGIRIFSANAVTVENVSMDGFSLHGISVETTANNLKLLVNDSSFKNNANHGINGFLTGSATASILVNDSIFNNNAGTAVNLGVATKANVTDSSFNGNGVGATVFGTDLTFTRCSFMGNTTAISSNNSAIVRLNQNTITGNGTGLSVSAGSILSYSNNAISGNTTNGAPTGTLLPL